MDRLIQALNIFLKYNNTKWPTHCEHDVLMIAGISKDEISDEDAEKLSKLDFSWSDEYDSWVSYHFGSA